MRLVRSIQECFLPDEVLEAAHFLSAITEINRFAMLLMLLDKKDLDVVASLFDKIQTVVGHTPPEGLPLSEVSRLRKAYLG